MNNSIEQDINQITGIADNFGGYIQIVSDIDMVMMQVSVAASIANKYSMAAYDSEGTEQHADDIATAIRFAKVNYRVASMMARHVTRSVSNKDKKRIERDSDYNIPNMVKAYNRNRVEAGKIIKVMQARVGV